MKRGGFFGLLDIDYAVCTINVHDLAKFLQLVVKVLTDADFAFYWRKSVAVGGDFLFKSEALRELQTGEANTFVSEFLIVHRGKTKHFLIRSAVFAAMPI